MYEWANVESLQVNYSITASKEEGTGKRISRTKGELLICPKRAELAALSGDLNACSAFDVAMA